MITIRKTVLLIIGIAAKNKTLMFSGTLPLLSYKGCHGVNHGAGANQRVARISTRKDRVVRAKEELRFGSL